MSAWALWVAASSSASHGAAAAASVNQGATPTASVAAGRRVTVSWGASTLSNGLAVDGYLVKRYTPSGVLQTALAGCSGTISALSCVETGVPAGSWRYTVTPGIATNWQGPESSQSGVVTVAAATLTLVKTLFGPVLPQSTTGAITGFAASEGVTYRLDAGTTLTGSPSSVGSAGTATISSLTIPSTTDGAHTVYALGNASPFASQASVAIVTDTIPPTVSAQLTPAANAAGWSGSSPVAVALSANDATGSGVAQITYTTDGSDPTTSGTAHAYSAQLSISTNTTIKYFATDIAGNSSGVQTQIVEIDMVAPTNALAVSNQTGGSSLAGGTVYYRGSAVGSLALTNALTDTGGSGPASSGTAALAGTSTGFSHTSSLVTTPAGGPYVSNAFSWSAGTASAPTETVTGSDIAGNTATSVLSFVDDVLAPAGGSVDTTGLVGTGTRYSQSQTLSVAFAKGTDAGSGLASSGAQLLRASAALSSPGTTAGACGSYGSYAQIGSDDPTSPVTDSVPSDNACYRYEYLVPDKVGNLATYTSPDIKVETTTPGSLTPPAAVITPVTGTASQFVSGSTVYYNPNQGGSFTAAANASDTRSGVAQVAFPVLAGFTGGGNVTTPSAGTTFTATYSWSANAAFASPGAQTLTATDNAAGAATNASAFIVVKDATPPAAGSVDATGLVGAGGRYAQSSTLSIVFNKGADGGSGLAASGAQLLRASATLSSGGTADGTCGAYGAYAQVGANDPTAPTSDTVSAGPACYRYEYVVADTVGNQATYTSPDIKVDTTAPAAPTLGFSALANAAVVGSAIYYLPSATSGSFTLTASASDLFSGIASYGFPTFGSGWTATPGALGVETYSYAAVNPTAPSGTQSVTATSHATVQSAGATFTATPDATPPSGGSVSYTNGSYTSASVSVSFTPGADAGSGVNAGSGLLQREAATLAAGACGSYGAFATVATNPVSPYADTTVSGGNCYQYRYVISDVLGNQATYTSASVAQVDTQAPTQAFSLASPLSAYLSGTTLYFKGNGTGSFKLVDTLTDPVSGVASASFPNIATTGWTHATETLSTPTGGPFTSSTFSWTANPSAPSGYAVTGLDNAGNSGASTITFTSDTTAPAGGSISYANGVQNTLSVPITTTNGTDAQSGVNAPGGSVGRAVATLTTLTETCGGFSGFTPVTLAGGADTTVTSGHCYEYEYLVSDNVGNQATYTSPSMALVDTTGPQVTAISSLQSGGGAGNGKLENGDKLVLTFNQSLAAASVPSTISGASENRAGTLLGVLVAPDVTLTIPQIAQGVLDTGSAGYLGGGCIALCSAEAATFGGAVVLANAGRSTTVTINVTGLAGSATNSSSGVLGFTPAASITDGGGDAARGTLTTSTGFKLF